MRKQERFRLAREHVVAVRVKGQPFLPLLEWLFKDAMEQHLEALPLLVCHRSRSLPSGGALSTARLSQARAIAH